MRFARQLIVVPIAWVLCSLTGCVFLPQAPGYKGPEERPASLIEYYRSDDHLLGSTEKTVEEDREIVTKEILVRTTLGEVKVDYFQRRKTSDDLIFVFPVLGGKYKFEKYFARYFAERGFDSAIVHRNNEFRDPKNIERIEEIFRNNIRRDRLIIDFFEQHHQKKDFGSFGLSRGAINAAALAGIDGRLKYNVFILGGANLVGMFQDSGERGVKKFIRKVTDAQGISRKQLFAKLKRDIKTDPQYVAKHVDARNTLMVLALFDQSVPIEYGFRLRRELGRPQTVLIPTGHYTSLLFTQFVRLLPPNSRFTIFPYDFVETEALSLYDNRFKTGNWRIRELPVRLVKIPSYLIAKIVQLFAPSE